MKTLAYQNSTYEFDQNNKLGSGSFASVYKGIKKETNEAVAIKRIDLKIIEKYGNDIKEAIGCEVNILQSIALLSSKIKTPFIVKILDCF
jgi:serine/threonine protein kinase